MKKNLLLLFMALFCASVIALSETNNSTPTTAPMSNETSARQVNESTFNFTMVNLTEIRRE